MANLNMVDEGFANLNIMDEEEDPMMVVGDDIAVDEKYGLCLVGRVLTDNIVNFLSLRNILANLWHPLIGVSIVEIEEKYILFRFYSEIDLKQVMDGVRIQFKFHRSTIFWVQTHNLPIGFLMEGMARQFGDFVGRFLEYDLSLVTKGLSKFMQEEFEADRWARIEVDGDRRERSFGDDRTNRINHKEGKGLEGIMVKEGALFDI
ncbi:hypothetical protein GOBAR_AA32143 [Gossypium barbadense]|uniref:DUF4283 domain-containing protein n=1 Tax=Gossypium barbadense TaxID=3634 RepID=A0A2P5WBT7_GOSBA|nr:hypothetical protein GOBAR_AA32143 [Gossypium barbadense]